MPSPRRSRPQGDGDTLIAEFTSGQLVVGICVALFVAMVCFLAGVLLGRYDNTPGTHAVAEASGVVGEGSQLSPRPNVLSSPTRATNPPATQFTTPEERTAGGRTTTLPPLSASGSTTGPVKIERVPSANQERPVTITNAPQPPGARTPGASAAPGTPPPPPPRDAQPQETPPVQVADAQNVVPPADPDKGAKAPVEKPVKLDDLDPAEEDLEALDELPAPTEKPAAKPAANPKPEKPAKPQEPAEPEAPLKPADKPAARPTGAGGFGIQVASFMGADREKRAEEARQKYASSSGMSTQVLSSADGSIHRVLIVGFKDKSAATSACQELRQKDGFKDAFVKEVSK